ncbi:MAG TPA: EcsC family protein [Myxococcaceae bacterium]|nr:EcsC family protein [Myxococcaceae bacterium]
MAFWDPVTERLSSFGRELKKLTPANLRKLANTRVNDLVLRELTRSKERVGDLERRYPSADQREKAQRLIDGKKAIAGTVGGVSGMFGLVSIPADLLVMTYLQIILLVDIATLYKANLKSDRGRTELMDVLGYANGVGPFQRAGPKMLGSIAGKLLEKGGLSSLGRALPLVAAPITAYLNNQHIQAVGEEAVRFYEGFGKAEKKSERRSRPAAQA